MTALQKWLFLALAVILVMQSAAGLLQYLHEMSPDGRFGGDFIAFWRAANHVQANDVSAIYDPAGWSRVLSSGQPAEFSWFLYPPYMLFLLLPLGGLTYGHAVLWWTLLPLPLFGLLLWRLAGRSSWRSQAEGEGPVPRAGAVVLFATALPFLAANAFSGQTGALVGLLFLGMACCWRTRPVLAGMFIGLVAIKPQLGLLLPVALVAAGQWRTILSASVTVLALAAGATLWLGPAIWADYLAIAQIFSAFIRDGYSGLRALAVGPYVSLQAVGVPEAVAVLIQAVISLAAAGLVYAAFRRPSAGSHDPRLDLKLGVLGAASLLVTPYSLMYDTPLLVIAVLPLLARAWRRGIDPWETAVLFALVAAPYAQLHFVGVHIPFGFLAVLGALAVTFRRLHLELGEVTAAAR